MRGRWAIVGQRGTVGRRLVSRHVAIPLTEDTRRSIN